MNTKSRKTESILNPSRRFLAIMITIALVGSMMGIASFASAGEDDIELQAIEATVQLDLQNASVAKGGQTYSGSQLDAIAGEDLVFTVYADDGFELTDIAAKDASTDMPIPLSQKDDELLVLGDYVNDDLVLRAHAAEPPVVEPETDDPVEEPVVPEFVEETVVVPQTEGSVVALQPNGPSVAVPTVSSDSAGSEMDPMAATDLTAYVQDLVWKMYIPDETVKDLDSATEDVKKIGAYQRSFRFTFTFEVDSPNNIKAGDYLTINYEADSTYFNFTPFGSAAAQIPFVDKLSGKTIGSYYITKENGNKMTVTLTFNDEVEKLGVKKISNCAIVTAQNNYITNNDTVEHKVILDLFDKDVEFTIPGKPGGGGPGTPPTPGNTTNPPELSKGTTSTARTHDGYISGDDQFRIGWYLETGRDLVYNLVKTNGAAAYGTADSPLDLDSYYIEDVITKDQGVIDFNIGPEADAAGIGPVFYYQVPYAYDKPVDGWTGATWGGTFLGGGIIEFKTMTPVTQNEGESYEDFKQRVTGVDIETGEPTGAQATMQYGIYTFPADDLLNRSHSIIVNYGNPKDATSSWPIVSEDWILEKAKASSFFTNKQSITDKVAAGTDLETAIKADPEYQRLVSSQSTGNCVGGRALYFRAYFSANYEIPTVDTAQKTNIFSRFLAGDETTSSSSSYTFKATAGSGEMNIVPGSLQVKKLVEGDGASDAFKGEKEFEFTLTTEAGAAVANQAYALVDAGGNPLLDGNGIARTGTTDANGVFKLKHGETALFTGFAYNAKYIVKESDTNMGDYYEGTSNADQKNNKSGAFDQGSNADDPYTSRTITIGNDYEIVVSFTNSYVKPAEGSLEVMKTVQMPDGMAIDRGITYSFTLTFDASPVANKAYTVGDDTRYTDEDGTFTLAHGETALFDGLEAGEYVIAETGSSGTPANATLSLTKYDVLGGRAEVVSEEKTSVGVTNVYTRDTGDLDVTKTVVDKGGLSDADADYTFTLKMGTSPVADKSFTIIPGGATGSTDGNGTFTLKAGQTASFAGLPTGDYTVDEGVITAEGITVTTTYAYLDNAGKATVTKGGKAEIGVTNTYTKDEPVIDKDISADGSAYGKGLVELANRTDDFYYRVSFNFTGVDMSKYSALSFVDDLSKSRCSDDGCTSPVKSSDVLGFDFAGAKVYEDGVEVDAGFGTFSTANASKLVYDVDPDNIEGMTNHTFTLVVKANVLDTATYEQLSHFSKSPQSQAIPNVGTLAYIDFDGEGSLDTQPVYVIPPTAEPEYAHLEVSKAVEIAGEVDIDVAAKEFTFVLFADGEAVTGAHTYIHKAADGTETTRQTAADGTFTLKDGEKALFSNLPVDNGLEGDAKQVHTYAVEEIYLEAEAADGITFDVINAVDGTAAPGGKTESFGLVHEQTVYVDFVNSYRENPPLGNEDGILRVTKAVEDDTGLVPADKAYTFVITDASGAPLAAAPYTLGDGTASATGPDGSFTLKAGETALFLGLSAGDVYAVFEAAASRTVSVADLNIKTVVAVDGDVATEALGLAVEVDDVGEGKLVAFTNSYTKPTTPDNPDNPGNPDNPKTPSGGSNTGKSSPITGDPLADTVILLGAIAALSGLGLFVGSRRRKGGKAA